MCEVSEMILCGSCVQWVGTLGFVTDCYDKINISKTCDQFFLGGAVRNFVLLLFGCTGVSGSLFQVAVSWGGVRVGVSCVSLVHCVGSCCFHSV